MNFVLRENFEGAETRLRYGAVTQGRHDDLQVAQLIGHSWGSGQAFFNYEYYDRTALHSSDRDFIPLAGEWTNLIVIPGQKRQNALGVISQRLSDQVELSGDIFYGRRQSSWTRNSGLPVDSRVESDVRQYGGSASLTVDVAKDWQIRFSGLLNQNDSEQRIFDAGLPSPGAPYFGNESRLWSVDLAADGSAMDAPGGAVRVAIGAQARGEEFVEEYLRYPARLEREAVAAYAEVRIPWITALNRRSGFERLELTLAARYEDYSDFGSTFNPKVGLSWAPVGGLNIRGTWGTSFKAPLLSQMNPADINVIVSSNYADVSGNATGVLVYGSGVDLQPEESTNWTAGIDFIPPGNDKWKFSFTYFDIAYERRISSPTPSDYFIGGVLLDPLYDLIVTQEPHQSNVEPLLAHPSAICFTPTFSLCPSMPSADQIDAIIDQRLRNLARVQLSGLDFSAGVHWPSDLGDWRIQMGGTLLLDNRRQFIPGAPKTNELNDVWRPVDFRMRNSVSWSRGALSATAFVNYTDSYRDTRDAAYAGANARPNVSSWTTVDLTLQYDLRETLQQIRVRQAALTLNAINILDRDPPFVGSQIGAYYDGVNASPLGRFLSVQLTTRW